MFFSVVTAKYHEFSEHGAKLKDETRALWYPRTTSLISCPDFKSITLNLVPSADAMAQN